MVPKLKNWKQKLTPNIWSMWSSSLFLKVSGLLANRHTTLLLTPLQEDPNLIWDRLWLILKENATNHSWLPTSCQFSNHKLTDFQWNITWKYYLCFCTQSTHLMQDLSQRQKGDKYIEIHLVNGVLQFSQHSIQHGSMWNSIQCLAIIRPLSWYLTLVES